MKQYNEGDFAYVAKEGQHDIPIGTQVEIKDIYAHVAHVYYTTNTGVSCDNILLSDLSPYPPVKAVERYVVVDADGNMYDAESQQPTFELSIEHFCKWYNTDNWDELEQLGYRCIPVTITAKKD